MIARNCGYLGLGRQRQQGYDFCWESSTVGFTATVSLGATGTPSTGTFVALGSGEDHELDYE